MEVNTESQAVTEAAVDTSTPDTEVSPSSAVVESTEPAYTPNYKYSVKDKEFEFDAELREAVKSKQAEDKLRDLYTKAMGLDPIKQERDSIKAEFGKVKPEFETMSKNVSTLKHFRDTGDLDNLFKMLDLDDKKLYEHTLRKLDAKELPQQYQQQYNKLPELQSQNYFLQQQLQELAQQQQSIQDAQARARYEQAKSAPEVKAFVDSFEQKNGPGAFTEEVKMRGLAFHRQNGYDADPETIVKEILNRFQLQPLTSPQATVQATNTNQANPPVIPVAKGGNVSPVRKRVQSIADLEKEYQSLS